MRVDLTVKNDLLRGAELLDQSTGAATSMRGDLRSVGLEHLFNWIVKIAQVNGHILIEGQTGTGKSTIAAGIHDLSSRSLSKNLRRGCGEFDEATFSAMLFGHTKDAFTGAFADKPGVLEIVNEGTLILDDIDYLSLPAQQALLRVLDDGIFYRLGEPTIERCVNFRLIATTNKHLETLIERGEFLPDLYYRICRWRIDIPPLRERRAQFERIVRTTLRCLSGQDDLDISKELIQFLADHNWPGNLRELQDVLANLVLFCSTEEGGLDLQHCGAVLSKMRITPIGKQDEQEKEDHAILACLNNTNWNISLTARLLQKSRTTIHSRIKAHDWRKPIESEGVH